MTIEKLERVMIDLDDINPDKIEYSVFKTPSFIKERTKYQEKELENMIFKYIS